MELKKIEKLLDLLPEGTKKDDIRSRMQTLAKKKNTSGQGLHDEFSMKPTGNILIQEINKEGEVVGVLAEQPNLVVDGAEEILLRAFSGDPSRTLYKNRVLKEGQSSTYHVRAEEIMTVEDNSNIATLHPNEFWKEVNDDEFEIEYSYYPNTLYIKEEQSLEPNQKAFSIVSSQNSSTAPLSAEIYSSFTNLFIGLGDGLNYNVPLTDARLSYEGAFEGEEARETSQVNDAIAFTEKVSNFEVTFKTSNKGGNVGIYVNETLRDTVSTLDANLADEEEGVLTHAVKDLDQAQESEVRLVFEGADEGVTNPVMAIESIQFDAFHTKMNGLIHEFENYTNSFDTATPYNTTSSAPYTITLDHAPVQKGSVDISYNNVDLNEVESRDEVVEGTFYVDDMRGLVYFNRALTNLMVTFETTGQIGQDEKISNPTITTKSVYPQVTDEVPEGNVDGVNETFKLKHQSITAETVKLNGTTVSKGNSSGQYNINSDTGVVTLNTAPSTGDTVSVDYTFNKTVNVLQTDYTINAEKEFVLYDQYFNPMVKVDDVNGMTTKGSFTIDSSDLQNKSILIDRETTSEEDLKDVVFFYYSQELPGVETNYARQVVLKPKEVNDYPWYALDKGSVQFVAEFDEDVPNSSVTIREMGLFDGPRIDDNVKGFSGYPVKAFSLVRIGESRKDTATGIRVTWTITLTNENGEPFQGGL